MKTHKYKVTVKSTGNENPVVVMVEATGEIEAIKQIYSQNVEVKYSGGQLAGEYSSQWIVWHKSQILAEVTLTDPDGNTPNEVRSYYGRLTAKPGMFLLGAKTEVVSSKFEARRDAVQWIRAIKDGQRQNIATSNVCPSFDPPEIPTIDRNPAADMHKLEDLQVWNFEIYTRNPETGETGWNIEFVNAFGVTKADAIAQLRRYPNFDCVITSTADFNGCPLNEDDIAAFAAGRMFRTVTDEGDAGLCSDRRS